MASKLLKTKGLFPIIHVMRELSFHVKNAWERVWFGNATVRCGWFALAYRPKGLLNVARWIASAKHRREVRDYLKTVGQRVGSFGEHERARMTAEFVVLGRAEIRANPRPEAAA